MNILNTMYKLMRQAKMMEKSNSKLTRDNMQKLLKTDNAQKYELEKSYLYIGYKFLWIM